MSKGSTETCGGARLDPLILICLLRQLVPGTRCEKRRGVREYERPCRELEVNLKDDTFRKAEEFTPGSLKWMGGKVVPTSA